MAMVAAAAQAASRAAPAQAEKVVAETIRQAREAEAAAAAASENAPEHRIGACHPPALTEPLQRSQVRRAPPGPRGPTSRRNGLDCPKRAQSSGSRS